MGLRGHPLSSAPSIIAAVVPTTTPPEVIPDIHADITPLASNDIEALASSSDDYRPYTSTEINTQIIPYEHDKVSSARIKSLFQSLGSLPLPDTEVGKKIIASQILSPSGFSFHV